MSTKDIFNDLGAGLGVAGSLQLVEMYLYRRGGVSKYALAAGALAAAHDWLETFIVTYVATEDSNPLKKLFGAAFSLADLAVSVGGAAAIELDVAGAGLSRLASMDGAKNVAIGAAAAYAGLSIGRYISGNVLIPVLLGDGSSAASSKPAK